MIWTTDSTQSVTTDNLGVLYTSFLKIKLLGNLVMFSNQIYEEYPFFSMNLTKLRLGFILLQEMVCLVLVFFKGLLPHPLYTEGHKGRCKLGARRADKTDL